MVAAASKVSGTRLANRTKKPLAYFSPMSIVS